MEEEEESEGQEGEEINNYEIIQEEVKDKPAEMQEKILAGKLASYFKDQVFMEQPYIKDDSKSVRDLVTEASQKFGERVEITKIVRFSTRG